MRGERAPDLPSPVKGSELIDHASTTHRITSRTCDDETKYKRTCDDETRHTRTCDDKSMERPTDGPRS